MKFSMNEVLMAMRAKGLHDEFAAVGIVLQQRAELLEALNELLHNSAPPHSGESELDADFSRRYEVARDVGLKAIANAEK